MAAFESASLGLFLWWRASAALNKPSRAPSISRFGVAETAERIEAGALSRGLQVLERTDHSGLAARAGYRLRPTQSLLVDGAVDGALVRVIVWQARSGATMVSLDRFAEADARSSDGALPGLLRALAPEAQEITLG